MISPIKLIIITMDRYHFLNKFTINLKAETLVRRLGYGNFVKFKGQAETKIDEYTILY